jgi:hypothetical protein
MCRKKVQSGHRFIPSEKTAIRFMNSSGRDFPGNRS